jgi:hypothetical protein
LALARVERSAKDAERTVEHERTEELGRRRQATE